MDPKVTRPLLPPDQTSTEDRYHSIESKLRILDSLQQSSAAHLTSLARLSERLVILTAETRASRLAVRELRDLVELLRIDLKAANAVSQPVEKPDVPGQTRVLPAQTS